MNINGRGQNAVLTGRGLQRLRQAWPTHLASMRRHVLDHLQGLDLPALSAALQRFAAGMPIYRATLPDTLRSTRVHGVVCFTGMLSNQWIIDKFYPIGYIPQGVRLTAYSGEAAGLLPAVLQGFIDAVRDGAAVVPIGAVYQIDQIVEAHTAMEEGRVAGKIVVLT